MFPIYMHISIQMLYYHFCIVGNKAAKLQNKPHTSADSSQLSGRTHGREAGCRYTATHPWTLNLNSQSMHVHTHTHTHTHKHDTPLYIITTLPYTHTHTPIKHYSV